MIILIRYSLYINMLELLNKESDIESVYGETVTDVRVYTCNASPSED